MNHEVDFSDEVLEETPVRATKLLSGIAANSVIRTLMAEAGMTDAEIRVGQDLLMESLGASLPPKPVTDTVESIASRNAIAKLDDWDGPHFVRLQSILTRGHVAVRDYIFNNLSAGSGPAAVTSVATFCQRVRSLEQKNPVSPAISVETAQAALARMAERGYTSSEITRLENLVTTALGPSSVLPNDNAETIAQKRRGVLRELKLWYDEWADTARTAIKRRDYLIRLGLAHRKQDTDSTQDVS